MTLSSDVLAAELRAVVERSGWEDVVIDAYAADPATGQPSLVEVERWSGNSCPFRVQVDEALFVVEFGVGSRIETHDSAELRALIDALLSGRIEERVWRRGEDLKRTEARLSLSSGLEKRVVTRHGLFGISGRKPNEINRYEPYQ